MTYEPKATLTMTVEIEVPRGCEFVENSPAWGELKKGLEKALPKFVFALTHELATTNNGDAKITIYIKSGRVIGASASF